ncbi:hypothetical protein GCM10010272_17200 [Streptomyces lateritius]|nr:hypothetical protein GCM10010272_17200 [Streptomyces lateritius]
MPEATSALQYETLCMRRSGLTRDLPPGTPKELQWVVNTATLIFGERDAVLVDTSPPASPRLCGGRPS